MPSCYGNMWLPETGDTDKFNFQNGPKTMEVVFVCGKLTTKKYYFHSLLLKTENPFSHPHILREWQIFLQDNYHSQNPEMAIL